MKRKILITASVLFAVGVCIIGYTQATTKTSAERAQQREQRHIEREKRRAERQAEYEKYIDSIVLARNFQFNPQSMQQQPAGQCGVTGQYLHSNGIHSACHHADTPSARSPGSYHPHRFFRNPRASRSSPFPCS